MKIKDWIKELQNLDPERELYFHQRGSNGEDWGYIISTPRFQNIPLEKIVKMKVGLIYPEEGRKNAKPLGECATLDISCW